MNEDRATNSPAKRWQKAVSKAVLVVLLLFMSYFHFDWRCLSGFRLLDELPEGAAYMCTDETWMDDPVQRIYVSNQNFVLLAVGRGEHDDWRTSGPTILVFKSGRFRVTHGAYVNFGQSGCTVYAM